MGYRESHKIGHFGFEFHSKSASMVLVRNQIVHYGDLYTTEGYGEQQVSKCNYVPDMAIFPPLPPVLQTNEK